MDMRKSILVAAALVSATITAQAGEQRIAVVNMNELIKAHPGASADRAALEERVKEYEAEQDDAVKKMEALKAELTAIGKRADSKALNATAREDAMKEAEGKLLEFRRLQRQSRETTLMRQKQLAEERAVMQERLAMKLRNMVKEYAAGKYTLVLDSSVLAAGAIGAVVYNDDAVDITDVLVKQVEALSDSE